MFDATWVGAERRMVMHVRTLFAVRGAAAGSRPVRVRSCAQQFDSVAGDRGARRLRDDHRDHACPDHGGNEPGQEAVSGQRGAEGHVQGRTAGTASSRDGILRGQLENAQSDLDKISRGRDRPQGDSAGHRILQGLLRSAGWRWSAAATKAAAVVALRAFVEKSDEQPRVSTTTRRSSCWAIWRWRCPGFDNGIKYYDMLGEAPWPDAKMKSAVLEGNAMLANALYSEALAKFDGVLATSLDDARAREQKLLATLGRSRVPGRDRQAGRGYRDVEKIIVRTTRRKSPCLFARAYNALGTCYLKANKREDALLAFLHVDLLFNQDPDAHAEALYHLSSLWKGLNKSERATKARSLLESRYSGSPWANKKDGK